MRLVSTISMTGASEKRSSVSAMTDCRHSIVASGPNPSHDVLMRDMLVGLGTGAGIRYHHAHCLTSRIAL